MSEMAAMRGCMPVRAIYHGIWTIALTVGVIDASICAPGWTLDAQKGRCIKVMEPKLDYDSAVLSCKKCGAQLLRMENDLDRQFMVGMNIDASKIPYMYIGRNHRAKMGEWRHENGGLVTWSAWRSGQPDGSALDEQRCMLIKTADSMRMGDYYCSSARNYICMKSAGKDTFIAKTYRAEPTKCLEKQSMTKHTVGVSLVECAASCNANMCCTAFGSDNSECSLYAMDFNRLTAECFNSSYQVFSKQYEE